MLAAPSERGPEVSRIGNFHMLFCSSLASAHTSTHTYAHTFGCNARKPMEAALLPSPCFPPHTCTALPAPPAPLTPQESGSSSEQIKAAPPPHPRRRLLSLLPRPRPGSLACMSSCRCETNRAWHYCLLADEYRQDRKHLQEKPDGRRRVLDQLYPQDVPCAAPVRSRQEREEK